MKIPYLLSVLGLVLGMFIAILFGVNEHMFKDRISAGLENNQKIQSIEDPEARKAKIAKESSKNWRYYQRFHFHSTGIGSMSLALLIFLSFVGAPKKQKKNLAYMISVGGFLYPFVGLFAAEYGPEMGRHEAKEAFQFFAWGGGVMLLGSIGLLAMAVKILLV
jgi:hypothetical protein